MAPARNPAPPGRRRAVERSGAWLDSRGARRGRHPEPEDRAASRRGVRHVLTSPFGESRLGARRRGDDLVIRLSILVLPWSVLSRTGADGEWPPTPEHPLKEHPTHQFRPPC